MLLAASLGACVSSQAADNPDEIVIQKAVLTGALKR